MKVEQVYSILNTIVTEATGGSAVVQENLSNIADIGATLFDNTSYDKYANALIDAVGKRVFVDRAYQGSIPSILKDNWEFGACLQKIQMEYPTASKNDTWDLTNGTDYSQDVFYKPTISAKYYHKYETFEIPMSFTDEQIKGSFNSADEMNSFMSMIYSTIDGAMSIMIDELAMRLVNNLICLTIENEKSTLGATYVNSGVKAVNLLKLYNTANGTTLTYDKAITEPSFLRFASYTIKLYSDRMTKISTLFNIGGKKRFTPKDNQHLVLLNEFASGSDVYLESDVFHNELTALPKADRVAYWQGSGTSYAIGSTSNVNVTTKTDAGATATHNLTGVLGVLFDDRAIALCNSDRKTTTHYNARAEFTNNYFKYKVGQFADTNENFVVFFAK